MARPRGVQFDRDSLDTFDILFTTDQVCFHNDGSLTLVLFGIKNDASRTGFEIKIPGGSQPMVDPVACLWCYIDKTEPHRPPSKPVFMALKSPYSAIAPATVAKILQKAIERAGLGGQGYTARSFRPTGATAAIASGCLPETAMQLGRWKTKEVFFNRYVYPRAPDSYTDDVLNFQGI